MRTRATIAHNGGHSKKKSKPVLCSEPDCGRNAYARRLCQTHHRQVLKVGKVLPIRPYRPRTPGTVKYDQFRVTSLCADKLKTYADKRNLSEGAIIAEVLEDWAAHRGKKGAAVSDPRPPTANPPPPCGEASAIAKEVRCTLPAGHPGRHQGNFGAALLQWGAVAVTPH